MNVNLEELSIEQLKAMAYDQLVALQVAQNNIRIIEDMIQKKVRKVEVGNGPT